MIRRIAYLLICCLILNACTTRPVSPSTPAAPAAVQPGAELKTYRLGVGDRVRIDVFNEPDLSMEAVVSPTGQFSYPLLGSVPALHQTAEELQKYVQSGLANGYLVNPDVRVSVVQYRPFYVIGQVQKAGAYPYVIGLTVEKALALAGGLTALASTRKIYLIQENGGTEKRLHVTLDALILPGDTLLVEEGLF